ncbi:MetQ/NlpA family ABC transporter substrate-binding protein [Yersinia kristensenii]|uniref:MetQ/NlpA family ABC transporter substrate-binding protein n=1 Tax=Yersinia kristensenii TaxID=28152 RepID=UPI0001A5437B|nr:Methionine import ATP-binding protein metN 2 [Yersinia kristensenii ATCC 33638]SUP71064.1 ABC transporter ATP-binding protein [Yersinia kristensenii]
MIVLSNVSKIFNSNSGQVLAVDAVNLQIQTGQIYGIVGYSGAGKSTLIRLFNGLEQPTSGSILIAGNDISSAKGNALRQARLNISMVFQHFNLLWSRTVSENIAFSLEIAGASKTQIKNRVAELIALVGLQGRENAYPSQLSGGHNNEGDAVVINANYAIDAGLNPTKDPIAVESGEDNPYANIITVHKDDVNKPEIKALVNVLHSKEIQDFIREKYQGAVIPVNQ